jgi:parallel beta-helix repeat protein
MPTQLTNISGATQHLPSAMGGASVAAGSSTIYGGSAADAYATFLNSGVNPTGIWSITTVSTPEINTPKVFSLAAIQAPLMGYDSGSVVPCSDTNGQLFINVGSANAPSWVPMTAAAFVGDATGSTDVSTAWAAQAPVAASLPQAELDIHAGSYKVAAPLTLPSATVLKLTPGTVLQNYQTQDVPSEDKNIFYSGSATRGDGGVPSRVLDTGQLHATPAAAATQTISYSVGTHAIKPVPWTTTTPGHFIELRRDAGGAGADLNKQQVFKVMAVSGSSSPYTVTLDRAIGWPYVGSATPGSGDTALLLSTCPQGQVIDGNNAALNFVTGGDSAVQFFEARDFEVRNVIADAQGNTTGFAGITDLGCYRGRWKSCTFRGFTYGFVVSSGEAIEVDDCDFEAMLNVTDGVGVKVWDALDFRMRASRSNGNLYGVVLSSNGGTFGSRNVRLEGSHFDNCSIIGIYIQLGDQIVIRDCTARNSNIGLSIASGVAPVTIDGLDVSGCASTPIVVANDNQLLRRIIDIRSATNAGDVQLLGNGDAIADSLLDMTALASSGVTGWRGGAVGGNAYIRDSNLILATNTYGIWAHDGVTWVSRCRFSGSAGAPVLVSSGATVVFDSCDFGSLFGNIVIASGGFSNIGPTASLPTALLGGAPGTRGYDTTLNHSITQKADASWA